MGEGDEAYRVSINHQLCLKSGQCAYLQPALFKINSEGAPTVIDPRVYGAQIAQAKEAAEMCPGQAISLSLLRVPTDG